MKGICPACGKKGEIDEFLRDEVALKCMAVIKTMPREATEHVFSYLILFNPQSGRTITMSKRLRLLAELKDLVAAPDVVWKKRAPRPNSPGLWRRAMEKMVADPPNELPLESHGYLRSVVYTLADQADAGNERHGETLKRYEHHRPARGAQSVKSPLAALAAGEIEKLPGEE